MRFAAIKRALAEWVLRNIFGVTPKERFLERTLADVASKLQITGTLTVIDAQGRVK